MKRRGKLLLIGLLGTIFLLGAVVAGCAPGEDMAHEEPAAEEAAAPEAEAPAPDRAEADMAAEEAERGEGGVPDGEPAQERRHVIRNARLALLVRDLEEAVEEVQQMVTGLGGYVSSMDMFGLEREQRAGQVVVRVPAEEFEQAVAQFEELGDLKDKNISSDDVTREYIDLEARIETLKSQEERFRELLQEAQNIEEILEVENELGRIRGELESKQAQFKNLREQVNYSTITINLEEQDPRHEKVISETEGMGRRIASLFSLNMNRLISALSSTAVFILGTLPITLPIIGLAAGGWRISKMVQKRKGNKS